MSNDSNRGLASADEQTRERVARAGGEAPHGGERGGGGGSGRESDDRGFASMSKEKRDS